MGEGYSADDRRRAADTSQPPDWAHALIGDVGDIRDRVSRIEGIGAALVVVLTLAVGVLAAVNH